MRDTLRRIMRGLAWGLWLVLVLGSPALAQLAAFETALDQGRLRAAERLADRLPAGPERSLALAQLGFHTGHPETSYPLVDTLRGVPLSPALKAKYLLILAKQQEIANRHGPSDNGSMDRLLRDGLASEPSAHDRVELLMMQLTAARNDPARGEQIVGQLFEISSDAGFYGRLRLLQQQNHNDELVALSLLLDQQARLQGQPALAARYRLGATMVMTRQDRAEEAAVLLRELLEETLDGDETYVVPAILSQLDYATREWKKHKLEHPVFEHTLERLGPGDVALKSLWDGVSTYPEHPEYFARGLAMAKDSGQPMLAAAFLIRQAERGADQDRAATYRQQARELLEGKDLRGYGGTWYGYAFIESPFAAGLDTEDDQEIWSRYQSMTASGRAEGAIAENWRGLLTDVPNRRAAWLWVNRVFGDIVGRTAEWSQAERSTALGDAISRLSHTWVNPRLSGQQSTFAPGESVIAGALGARIAGQPDLVEMMWAGLVQRESANTAWQPHDRLTTIGKWLAFMKREEEAADFYAAAAAGEHEYRVMQLRAIADLAGIELKLGRPAEEHLVQLTDSDLSKELSPFDQPWRRATELAWLRLDQGRPVEAERLARAGLSAVPKTWTPARVRRLGAHEALAFALADQGKLSEDFLPEWAQQPEAATWLATLRTDVLLRTGKVEEAAAMVPTLAAAEDDATRIYLANLRRKIALTQGDKAVSAEMERDISSTVEQMISGWPELRGPLLASPAYADLTFLQRPVPVTVDTVVRGQPEHMEPVIAKLEALRRREPGNEVLAQISAAQVRATAQAAGPGQVVVQPVMLSHSVLLVVCSNRQIGIWERFVDVDTVRKTMARLSTLAGDPNTSTSTLEADADYLSRRLLDPWREEFPGLRHLLWLAQGELKELPLSLLRLDGKSLLESTTVTYLDGPAGIPAFALDANQNVLLIGGSDDLPGTAVELAEVRALFPKGKSWRLGQDFGALQRLAEGHRLVHIASHGLPPTRGRAGGQLSGSEGDLSAFQLADLHFSPSTMVVATACQVGSETKGGPGDSTVLNAFRTAGARTVLGSPWPVDDASSRELVLDFYRHLMRKDSPPEALRKAQLTVRKAHSHPFYWAGSRILTGPALGRS